MINKWQPAQVKNRQFTEMLLRKLFNFEIVNLTEYMSSAFFFSIVNHYWFIVPAMVSDQNDVAVLFLFFLNHFFS